MHGDLLCTDDREYQQARTLLRSDAFARDFLSRPIEERRLIAADYRRRSGEATSLKADRIMDVNDDAVAETLRQQGALQLIHGHTHRPGMHAFELDGQTARRIVLPEWQDDRGGALRVTAADMVFEPCR